MADKKSGLECLREEMRKRGCSEQQTNSKAVAIVLDILASANANDEMHIYQDIQAAESKLDDVKRKTSNALSELNRVERDTNKEVEQLNAVKTALDNYIEDFKKGLLECETAEGRDRLRAAQMYINTVTVKTCYDNTAFITCLGAILTGQSIGIVKELKKINPELFKTKEEVDWI